MWDWLKEQLTAILQWLFDVFMWLPKKVWELFVDITVAALNAIPVPDWLAGLSASFAGLPPGVAFFLQALQLPTGLAMVGSAYLLRFLIRRLPVIG